MSQKFLSREEYPELYAAIAKAYPMSTARQKSITKDEAIDFLNLCKSAYTIAIKESDSPELIQQYRYEIRYWEDYLHANWPEERARRDPPQLFGGSPVPMTKEALSKAMDQVYARIKQVTEIEDSGKALDQVVAEIYGALKTLGAVVDEIVHKLPDEPRPDPARVV